MITLPEAITGTATENPSAKTVSRRWTTDTPRTTFRRPSSTQRQAIIRYGQIRRWRPLHRPRSTLRLTHLANVRSAARLQSPAMSVAGERSDATGSSPVSAPTCHPLLEWIGSCWLTLHYAVCGQCAKRADHGVHCHYTGEGEKKRAAQKYAEPPLRAFAILFFQLILATT